MRYEDGSSNTTTANTWRVITQQRRFIVRTWPRTSSRISRCSGKNCKNWCHTLTLAESREQEYVLRAPCCALSDGIATLLHAERVGLIVASAIPAILHSPTSD